MIALCVALGSLPLSATAARFGNYNARSMAMGGAGVASANADAAHYFNPALLATYPAYKERARQSRAVVPSAAVTVSDSVWHLAQFNHTNYENQLQITIDNYNLNSTAANAATVSATARDLRSMLDSVADQLLSVDGTLGLAFAVPSRWQGGTFFVQTRVAGAGIIEPTDDDRQLLDDYVDAMDYIATSGAQGRSVPALFDSQNKLIDLTDTLSSTATARGIFLTETGVAFADSIEFHDRTWRWGLTPKIQAVSSFDYVERAGQGGINVSQDSHYRVQPNADAGVALDVADRQRIGLVVKNIFPFKFTTPRSRDLAIDSQVRAGWAHWNDNVLLAVDVDLLPNNTIAEDTSAQDLAIGAEWKPRAWLRPRIGYNHNLRNIDTLGLVSAGFGLVYSRVEVDLTIGRGEKKRQAAVQLALPF